MWWAQGHVLVFTYGSVLPAVSTDCVMYHRGNRTSSGLQENNGDSNFPECAQLRSINADENSVVTTEFCLSSPLAAFVRVPDFLMLIQYFVFVFAFYFLKQVQNQARVRRAAKFSLYFEYQTIVLCYPSAKMRYHLGSVTTFRDHFPFLLLL
jgi:hypothetical protein